MSYRELYFDIETTGIRTDSDRITEIACYEPLTGLSFQSLVNPKVPIPDEITKITGITNEMVQNAPTFGEVAEKFFEFSSGKIAIIAHNGDNFDVPFMQSELARCKKQFPEGWLSIDSLIWARRYRRDLPRHSLQYLRQYFNIPSNHAHRALDDTITLHKVFSFMKDDLTIDEIIGRCSKPIETKKGEKASSLHLELFA